MERAQESEIKDDTNISEIADAAEMVDTPQKDSEIGLEQRDELKTLEAEVKEEGQDEIKEGIKLPSSMTKRQQKQFIRMLTGKKPIRANQTKANSDTAKKKKSKRKNVKAARRKNRK